MINEYVPQPILTKLPKSDAEIMEDVLDGIDEDNRILGYIAEAISRNSEQRVLIGKRLIDSRASVENPLQPGWAALAHYENIGPATGEVHIVETLPGESIVDAVMRKYGKDGSVG